MGFSPNLQSKNTTTKVYISEMQYRWMESIIQRLQKTTSPLDCLLRRLFLSAERRQILTRRLSFRQKIQPS